MRSAAIEYRPAVTAGGRGVSLGPILALWCVLAILGLGILWYNSGIGDSIRSFYILPWAFLTGLVVLAPSFYLYRIGKFDPFHPLVFAAWSYIFPAFVFGSVIIAFDWVDWFFMSFIDDPRYNLPLTLFYISIGFMGLTAGYFLPIGRWGAESITKFVPKWNWRPDQIWIPGIILVLLGFAINILGLIQGLLGFQRNIDIGAFDGLLSFLFIILTAGTVLLWLGIFAAKEKTGMYYVVLLVLLATIPLKMALLGNRSSLILSLIPIAFAFNYSGRKIRLQTASVFGLLAVIALFFGVAYGTTFRNIKGSEARMNAGDYFGQVVATVDYLLDEDPTVVFGDSAQALAYLIENLSSVAIVVSNYEKLAPYEASYGLENNITNDLYTTFIPRFVWADKPQTSDARAYSDLYFNFSENSFAISPFADLLRNFGPIGVPLGMALLGIYLRLMYSTLIDTPTPALWKMVFYFSMLTVISYEAFYATLFPFVVRTIFVLGISMLLVNVVVSMGRSK
ncbi:hypothetical protein BH24ACI3_BH24ACI3_06100 [soil metagenome]